jgi:hypothetical protein
MAGLREQLSAYQRSEFSLHLDLEALPRAPRVNDHSVHERSEIAD